MLSPPQSESGVYRRNRSCPVPFITAVEKSISGPEPLPWIGLRQHLLEIGLVGLDLVGREVAAGDVLGLVETALEADDQREILPELGVVGVVGLRKRAAQMGLGGLEVTRKDVGHCEIVDDRDLAGLQLERLLVELAGFLVAALLIEGGAERRADAPVGLATGNRPAQLSLAVLEATRSNHDLAE